MQQVISEKKTISYLRNQHKFLDCWTPSSTGHHCTFGWPTYQISWAKPLQDCSLFVLGQWGYHYFHHIQTNPGKMTSWCWPSTTGKTTVRWLLPASWRMDVCNMKIGNHRFYRGVRSFAVPLKSCKETIQNNELIVAFKYLVSKQNTPFIINF